MEPSALTMIADVLKATGPYGLVAVLGWAFWRLSERKDRELKALHERLLSMSEVQTAAITKMEAALMALKEAISDLRRG